MQCEYEKTLKTYHNSPAYLAYIAAKNRAAQGNDNDSHERSTSSAKQQAADRRIEIQPAEDEDGTYDRYLLNILIISTFIISLSVFFFKLKPIHVS